MIHPELSHKSKGVFNGWCTEGTEGTESHSPSVSPNSWRWKYPCLVDELKVTRMGKS